MPQVFAEELKSIPMSPNLGEGLERAHRFAREQGHRFVMLEHLLLALTEDQEAALILQSANVDLARLGGDVSSYLGQLLDDMRSDGSAEPRPDPELLRVLQAAASAAQQSKRRQIDGAIVLAAIVGDGKSPAAGLLKTHGMTFEEAIRALQRANTKARLKPIPKATATTPAAAAPPPEPAPSPAAREHAPPPQAAASLRVALPDPAPVQPDEPPAELAPAPESTRAAVQSADDILAAARARIQKRAATLNPPAPGALNGSPMSVAPEPEADDGMSSAMRELLSVSAPASAPDRASPPREVAQELNGAAHLHLVHSAPQEPVAPDLSRPVQAAITVAAHQPLPTAVSAAPSAPLPPLGVGGPARSARAAPSGPERMQPERAQPLPPWPSAAPGTGPGVAQRHPPSQLQTAEPHRLTRAATPLPSYPQGQPRKGSPGAERGPLVESIPRRMKLGVTSVGEVRIPRAKLDGLVQAMTARATQSAHEPIVARALSIRLRSPSESFFVEPVSPETVYLEAGSNLAPDDALHWRWHLTPRHRGKGKLTVLVSLHNSSLSGQGEELALPDRHVDVKVRGRSIRRLLRATFYMALLVGAVFLGRVGGELGPMLLRSLRSVIGL